MRNSFNNDAIWTLDDFDNHVAKQNDFIINYNFSNYTAVADSYNNYPNKIGDHISNMIDHSLKQIMIGFMRDSGGHTQ